MLKIKKYYKPFIWSIVFVICLLVIQAVCDLKLPDYMSNIVNIGIQSNGIENATPDAISENGLTLMTSFMSKEDKELVSKNYTKINKGDDSYIDDYPLLETESVYILNDIDNETFEKMNSIFSVSGKTMINVLSSLSTTSGTETDGTEIDSSSIDLSGIYEIIPMLSMIPEQTISEAREEAAQTDETTLSAIGKIFAR